jgi:hypothetical protein
VVRRMLDERFKAAGGWSQMLTGGVDWTKCQVVNGTSVCIGVEVEVSSRSDLLAVDVNHLRDAILSGKIDVGAIIVPSDVLGNFLTDRGPKMADARRHVVLARATDMPLILIAIEHDGAGDAFPNRPNGPPKASRRRAETNPCWRELSELSVAAAVALPAGVSPSRDTPRPHD